METKKKSKKNSHLLVACSSIIEKSFSHCLLIFVLCSGEDFVLSSKNTFNLKKISFL